MTHALKTKRVVSAAAPFLLLTLLVAFVYRKVLFEGEIYFFADVATQNYPWKQFFVEQLRAGTLPLWFPYMHSGFPLYAEIQAGFFYPPNWLAFLLFSTPVAYGLLLALHHLMGAWFSYLFGRQVGLSKGASLFAAVAVSLGAFFILHLVHLAMFITAAWLPVGLYMMERAKRRDSPRFLFLAMAPVLALQILAGHPQIVSYSVLMLSLYLVPYLYELFRKGRVRVALSMIAGWSAALCVSVLLSSAQVLPTLELIHHSARSGGVELSFAAEQSMPPWALVTYLLPDFFGFARPQANVDFWLFGVNYWELCPYVGILTLLLAAVPLFRRPLGSWAVFYVILFLSVLLMMGNHTPLYDLVRRIPPFHYFRGPVRFSLLATLCLAFLAGRGLDLLCTAANEDHQRLVSRVRLLARVSFFVTLGGLTAGVLFLWGFQEPLRQWLYRYGERFVLENIYNKELFYKPLAYYLNKLSWALDMGIPLLFKAINPLEPRVFLCLFFLAGAVILVSLLCSGTVSSRAFPLACTLLLVADLFAFGLRYNVTRSRSDVLSASPVVDFLKKSREPSRSLRDVACNWMDIQSEKNLLPVSMGSLWKISSADSFTPLEMSRYSQILELTEKDRAFVLEGRSSHLNLLSLLNVKHVHTCRALDDPRLQEVFREGALRVYRNPEALPHAFFVADYRVIREADGVLTEMKEPSFDFSRTVILEKPPSFPPVRNAGPDPGSASIRGTQEDAGRLEFQVTVPRPGLFVLAETFYPGWRAWVDDRPERIVRADFVYQAVPLSAGTHRVRFQYVPDKLKVGVLLSLMGLALWSLGVILFAARDASP